METLSKKEIIEILKDDSINEALFAKADSVRKKYTGDEVHLRALIEFSNICRCKCKYCGIRAENSKVARYRLSDLEIVKTAENAVAQGYKTIVLQSGEDMYFTADRLCEIIKKIKTYDTAVTLSIGERSRDEYKMFKDAGADRYLIRIETTDRNLYKKMHPYADFDFSGLVPLQMLHVSVGWLQALQNDRELVHEYVAPGGAEIVAGIGKWNAGISNRLYYGRNIMPYYNSVGTGGDIYATDLYFGNPFYRLRDMEGWHCYDRLEVFYAPRISDYVDLKVAAVLHFCGGYAGWQQMVTVHFNLQELLRSYAARH